MEETISFEDVLKTVIKHIRLIAIVTILAITITGLISYLVLTPVYEASADILINQNTGEADQSVIENVETDLQLVNTYSGIIKSPLILNKVLEEMNLDMTTGELIKKMSISNDDQSQIVNIAVEDKNPETAAEIANTIAAVFKTEIISLMNVDNVTLLSPAVIGEDQEPVSPYPMLNMAIAAILGLMLGTGIAFLLEYFNTTIKDQQDIKDTLGIPLIGIISPFSKKEGNENEYKLTSRRRGEVSNGQKEKASSAISK